MKREVNTMFGLGRRKDPICGMKEEKGKGSDKDGKWFCSEGCVKEYEKQLSSPGSPEAGAQKKSRCGCC